QGRLWSLPDWPPVEPLMYMDSTILTGDMNGWMPPFSFWVDRFSAIMEK
ncbi:hypothetical protein HMPREF9374_1020, partial [Desmospora sp. 8437]